MNSTKKPTQVGGRERMRDTFGPRYSKLFIAKVVCSTGPASMHEHVFSASWQRHRPLVRQPPRGQAACARDNNHVLDVHFRQLQTDRCRLPVSGRVRAEHCRAIQVQQAQRGQERKGPRQRRWGQHRQQQQGQNLLRFKEQPEKCQSGNSPQDASHSAGLQWLASQSGKSFTFIVLHRRQCDQIGQFCKALGDKNSLIRVAQIYVYL